MSRVILRDTLSQIQNAVNGHVVQTDSTPYNSPSANHAIQPFTSAWQPEEGRMPDSGLQGCDTAAPAGGTRRRTDITDGYRKPLIAFLRERAAWSVTSTGGGMLALAKSGRRHGAQRGRHRPPRSSGHRVSLSVETRSPDTAGRPGRHLPPPESPRLPKPRYSS